MADPPVQSVVRGRIRPRPSEKQFGKEKRVNFKFDKDTVIIVLIGCVLMGAWMLYLPKYQAKRNAE